MSRKTPAKPAWCVYIVRCSNRSLYTGITNKLKDRIADHNSGRGAKYTASFGPVKLAWHKKSKNRSSASKLEAKIKKLTRDEKKELIMAAKRRKKHKIRFHRRGAECAEGSVTPC